MTRPSLLSDFAPSAPDPQTFVGTFSETAHRLVDCTFEAFSIGDGTRALACGRLIEIEPNIFRVVPIYLRQICGPHVPWTSPAPGRAIQTISPITSFDQAHDVLAWWATQTFSTKRRP